MEKAREHPEMVLLSNTWGLLVPQWHSAPAVWSLLPQNKGKSKTDKVPSKSVSELELPSALPV